MRVQAGRIPGADLGWPRGGPRRAPGGSHLASAVAGITSSWMKEACRPRRRLDGRWRQPPSCRASWGADRRPYCGPFTSPLGGGSPLSCRASCRASRAPRPPGPSSGRARARRPRRKIKSGHNKTIPCGKLDAGMPQALVRLEGLRDGCDGAHAGPFCLPPWPHPGRTLRPYQHQGRRVSSKPRRTAGRVSASPPQGRLPQDLRTARVRIHKAPLPRPMPARKSPESSPRSSP